MPKVERRTVNGCEIICSELTFRRKARLGPRISSVAGPGFGAVIPLFFGEGDVETRLMNADAGVLGHVAMTVFKQLDPDAFETIYSELLASTQVVVGKKVYDLSQGNFDAAFESNDELFWAAVGLAFEVSMIPFFKGAAVLMPKRAAVAKAPEA